jgi:hypothetical protein
MNGSDALKYMHQLGVTFVVDARQNDIPKFHDHTESFYAYKKWISAYTIVSFNPKTKSFHLNIVSGGNRSDYCRRKKEIHTHCDILDSDTCILAPIIPEIIIGGGHAEKEKDDTLLLDGSASGIDPRGKQRRDYFGVPSWLMEGFAAPILKSFPGIEGFATVYNGIKVNSTFYWDKEEGNPPHEFFKKVKEHTHFDLLQSIRKTTLSAPPNDLSHEEKLKKFQRALTRLITVREE